MQSTAKSPDDYFEQLPEDRKEAMQKLRKAIKSNLPKGFKEVMGYGMPGYVVPHELYPAGYHCDPKIPLPFISLASQKNHIAVYHMGIYSDKELMDWFLSEYPKHSDRKLDMGKSCLRFKNPDHIPFGLIGELSSKMTVDKWVEVYESNFRR